MPPTPTHNVTYAEFVEWARTHQDTPIGGPGICRTCPISRFVQSKFNDPTLGVAYGTVRKSNKEVGKCDDALTAIEHNYTTCYPNIMENIGAFCEWAGIAL